ncbi:MAG: glycoside hydrolase family 16 protein [Oscillochloris sp.]|nr:glycoside hydrolase family 16 protein [Oscillochloris sp.]
MRSFYHLCNTLLRRKGVWAAIILAGFFIGIGYLHITYAESSCRFSYCRFFPLIIISSQPTSTPTPTRSTTPTLTYTPTPEAIATATATVTTTPTVTSTPDPYLFNEDFNGTSIDTTKWTLGNTEGDTSNNEQECYQPENVTLTGGSLILTSEYPSTAIPCPNTSGGTTNYNYSSGLAQWKSFTLLYGVIEFRAKTPAASGQWPAIWLLGSNCQSSGSAVYNTPNCAWPADDQSSAEIDILEQFGSPLHNNMMIHNGPSADSDFYANGCAIQSLGFDNSADFHTYKLIWEPGKVTWQIDGITACTSTSYVPSHPMFLRINLAVGGGGGVINTSAFPQTLQVDYIRVSALNS